MVARMAGWIGRCLGLLVALLAAGALCGAGLLPGAIAREHGWALGPTGGSEGVMVHHLPAGGAWGEVRPGVRLAEPPVGMAAVDDEFLFVLPPSGDDATVLGVRSTIVRRLPNGVWQYDRHRVLAPIPLRATTPGIEDDPNAAGEPAAEESDDQNGDQAGDAAPDQPPAPPMGTLLGFAAARGAGPEGRLPIALLERAGQRTLLILAREGWRDAALPDDLAAIGRVWLVATDGALVLAQRSGGAGLNIWAIDAGSLHAAATEPTAAAAGSWQRWTAPVPTGDFSLHGIDGQLVLVSGVQGDGKRRIALLRPGRSQPIAEVIEQPGVKLAVTGMGTGGGAAVMVVGFPTETQTGSAAPGTRPRVWVWSLGGTLLFDGETVAISPVSLEQVGLLGLLLMSLFASILVFIARPASTWNPPINLPEGTSLASPGRRLLAFVLDLVPGMFASSILFPTGAGAGPLEPLGGIAPLLFVVLVTIVHSAITEAWVGRTLGKLVMGLRTIDAGGGKPSPWQAVLRSTIKIMCPPLMFLALSNPYLPGPAGFGTVVIVDDWKRDHAKNDQHHDDERKD